MMHGIMVGSVQLQWGHADELPADWPRYAYEATFAQSAVIDGVRMFPYIAVGDARIYLAQPEAVAFVGSDAS